jgi:hypothetical protein
MKPIVLFSFLISVSLNAQNCMISLEALDLLEYKYSSEQLGYKGPVKHVTGIHETQNEAGEFEIIHRVWGDHFLIDRLNFNEKGNLTTMYQEDSSGDTMVVIQIEYDAQDRISKIAEHEMNIWKKHEPFKGENWSSRTLEYSYKNQRIQSVLVIGQWQIGPYGDTCQVDYIYDGDLLTEQRVFSLRNGKTLLNTRRYSYSPKNSQLIKVVVGIDTSGKSTGTYQYNYGLNNSILESKVFTSSLDEDWNKEGKWYYDTQGNLKSYISGDTLADYWYCYKSFNHNQLNDVLSEYSNSEYDGRHHLNKIYTYIYDDKNNWTIQNKSIQYYIDFDDVTDRVENYRTRRKITYYKL